MIVYYKRRRARIYTINAKGYRAADPHDRELENAVEKIMKEQQGEIVPERRPEIPAIPLHTCRGR